MRHVEWVEPYDRDASIILTCRVTEDDAIKAQRNSGMLRGYVYKTDEQALHDFMAIHWGILITVKE